MVWLSQHASWGESFVLHFLNRWLTVSLVAQARNLQISTRSFGLDSSAVMVPGEEDDVNSLLNGSRKLAYLPSLSTTQSMWYKRRWMTITRGQQDSGYYGRKEDTLEIRYGQMTCSLNTHLRIHPRIMTRHHRILNELLLEAKKAYMAAQASKISIYVSDSYVIHRAFT